MSASSVVLKGLFPVSRRLRVVIGMPVRAAASRWAIPAALKAADTLRAIPRLVSVGVAMQRPYVPKW